jgi:predicted ATP-grasp superfamily ATP-dependent carboligase/ubiquinone/menaquinone biosynthesis C-methylase UbiE
LKAFVFKGVPAPFHHGALAVCRTLGRKGVAVTANDESAQVPSRHSRYRTESVIWDPWPGEPPSVVARLLEWSQRQGERALLIPVDDAATILVDTHRAELQAGFTFPVLPIGLAERLSSKWEMAELAATHGVATARVERIDAHASLDNLLDELGLPVVVKRISGWSIESRETPSVTLARSREEVVAVTRQGGDNVLLQEYIPGGPKTSWMFNGYFDAQSRCLFGLTGYKVRQYPVDGGFTTLGQLQHNEELLRTAVDFFQAVGYVGIVDVGFRFDARDSTYKLLDVNPRVGSTFRLFAADDGRDVVSTCYDDLNGTALEPVLSAPARTWQVEPHDYRVARQLARESPTSVWPVLSSAARASERAWFVADDWKPFIAAAIYGWRHRARRASLKAPSVAASSGTTSRFDETATYWRDIYDVETDVAAHIYRERLSQALKYVEGLGLGTGARALDVGAGAGVAATALAARGFAVTAIDSSERMLDLIRTRSEAEGLSVETLRADANALPVADASIDLVLALGLLPWVEDPTAVLKEISRVLRPGGAVVLSSDNKWRLAEIADPALSALAAPLRRRVKARLRHSQRRHLNGFVVRRHSTAELRTLLEGQGFDVLATATVGYGPITFMRRPVASPAAGMRIDAVLSRYRHSRLLRALGVHVVASAKLRA